MKKPQIALFIGVISISIFPILVKLELAGPLISAFYRMAIAAGILIPYALFTKQLKLPRGKMLWLTLLCGIFYGLDITVWNIAIQESTATKATLLTNLSPIWVGVGAFLFLKNKPKFNFWIGGLVAIFGMVVLVGFRVFLHLNFNLAFGFALLSGVIYAHYMLVSKAVLKNLEVVPFITFSTIASTVVLGIITLANGEPFTGYSNTGWLVFAVQGIICQFLAWMLLGYATKHLETTEVSVSLLGQAILTAFFAYLFIGEELTAQMIVGGIILIIGIRLTFLKQRIHLLPRKPLFRRFHFSSSSSRKRRLNRNQNNWK